MFTCLIVITLNYITWNDFKRTVNMTTIKISVKNKRDANMLYRMLKRIPFIDNVEKEDSLNRETLTGQFEKIKKLITAGAGSDLFKNITNPVTWQQELRNEWE